MASGQMDVTFEGFEGAITVCTSRYLPDFQTPCAIKQVKVPFLYSMNFDLIIVVSYTQIDDVQDSQYDFGVSNGKTWVHELLSQSHCCTCRVAAKQVTPPAC